MTRFLFVRVPCIILFLALVVAAIPFWLSGVVAGLAWMSLYTGFKTAWALVDFLVDNAQR